MLEIQRGACIQNGRVCFSSQVTFPLTKMAQAGKTRPFIFVFGKRKSGQTPKYSTAFWRRQLRVCCLTGGMLPVRTRGRRSRAWADLSVAYILKSLNNQVHNVIPCQLGELQSGSGPHLDLQSLPGAPQHIPMLPLAGTGPTLVAAVVAAVVAVVVSPASGGQQRGPARSPHQQGSSRANYLFTALTLM